MPMNCAKAPKMVLVLN